MTPVVPVDGTLRSGRDIAQVMRSSRQRAGRLLVVHARRRGDGQPARVAVVASRRVGGAVQRNRAKRLLREAVRHLDLVGGMDIVLVARRPCAEHGFADVYREVQVLAGQLDLVAPESAGQPA